MCERQENDDDDDDDEGEREERFCNLILNGKNEDDKRSQQMKEIDRIWVRNFFLLPTDTDIFEIEKKCSQDVLK